MASSFSPASLRHNDVIIPTRGFPIEIFDSPPNSKYLCAICRLILHNPLQSYCGHRYCQRCLDHVIKSSGRPVSSDPLVCPGCVEEGELEEFSVLNQDQTFPDNAIRREMFTFRVSCSNPGCSWKGLFREYETHSNDCDLRSIRCEFCEQSVQRNAMHDHVTREHLLEAVKPGHLCPLNCGKTIDDRGFRQHVEENPGSHLEVLHGKILELERVILPQRGSTASTSLSLVERMDRAEQAVQRLQNSTSGQRSEEVSASTSARRQPEVQNDRLPVTLDVLRKAAAVVNREQQKLAGRMASFAAQCSDNRRREFVVNEVLEAQDQRAELPVIDKLMKRLELLEEASTDGHFIWKIEDFNQRRTDAIRGTTSSLYSPPFYTSTRGYKLCCRIFLNGNGSGKGSHVSLFIVVMRGPHDALLAWPFRHVITMTIVDQEDSSRNVSDTFVSNAKSNSFFRPETEMNIASGFVQFLPLDALNSHRNSFVKDDVMFVKISAESPAIG